MTDTRVRDVMSPHVRLIAADDTIKTAAEAMEADDIGAVVVVDEGRVRALLTDRDIVVRAISRRSRPESDAGVVTLGDIAAERDPDSALATIGYTPPNR